MKTLPLTLAALLATTLLASPAAHAQPYTGAVSGITSQNPFETPNIPQPKSPDKTLDIKQFGAAGDGKTNDTPAINKAIQQLSSSGGGSIHFPKGKYLAAS